MFTIVIQDNNLFIQTIKRLHEEGIKVSSDGYRAIMDDLGAELIGSVRKHVIAGLKPRITFDNLDFKVLVNIILQNHRNSDMHWIAHLLTFDRVPSKCIEGFENIEYLLNKDDLQKLHSDFIILVARVLKEFLDSLKGTAVPEHIPHRYN